MLKFLIFIIAIQINLSTSSNINKNRITFDKTFNLYYVGIRYQIIISVISKSIEMHTGKMQDINKKISNSLSWNLEYDWHLTC